MDFFSSILDNTVGRIPVVGGSISGIGKSVTGMVDKVVSPAVNLFSGLAGAGTKMASAMTGVVTGLATTLSSPTFMYLVVGGLGLGAVYLLTKSDGSSSNNYKSFSPPSSAYVSALANLTPQGRMAGFAQKAISAYV